MYTVQHTWRSFEQIKSTLKGGNEGHRDGWRKGERKVIPQYRVLQSTLIGVIVSLCHTNPRLCPYFRKKAWLSNGY